MKIEDLDKSVLDQVTALYLSVAWPGREAEKAPEYSPLAAGEAALADFTDESKRDQGRVSRRYVKRLGNEKYPHMKLVVEEYLVPDEFVFTVDTHDQLELEPGYPDYDAWQELKAFNHQIKERIEEKWKAEGLHTYATLKEIVEGESRPAQVSQGHRILVVDDERDIADAVASILIGEGYEVFLAHDGQEAVDTALRERPDLVLMDFQMPRLDGVEASVRIRSVCDRKECRILLATASLVDLSRVAEADGFLLKPYSRDILVSFIHALLD